MKILNLNCVGLTWTEPHAVTVFSI